MDRGGGIRNVRVCLCAHASFLVYVDRKIINREIKDVVGPQKTDNKTVNLNLLTWL